MNTIPQKSEVQDRERQVQNSFMLEAHLQIEKILFDYNQQNIMEFEDYVSFQPPRK